MRIEFGDLVLRAILDPSSGTKLIADAVDAGKKAEKAGTFKIKPEIDKTGLDELNKYRDALARIQAEYRKTGGDGRKTANELRELAEAIERQRAALPATSTLFRAYDKTLTQTYSAANRLDGTLDRLSLGFSVGQGITRSFTSQLSRFGIAGGIAGDSLNLLATGATGLGTGAIAATAGIGALTVGLIALDKVGNANFKQLEEATDFLFVNGVENIDGFIQSLRELQDESKLAATFTTGQLANAAQEIVRANRSETESLDILRNSITFAVSEHKDLAEVGLELSTVMRQFNIDTSQAGTVANKFAQAGNLAKVGASEFLEGIANAGDQLAAFGFTLDEGLALLIEMDNKGFSPADKGARALSGALSAIGSPTQKAMGVFESLGITTSNVRERFIQLIEVLANNKDAASQLQDAFDDQGESIEFLGQIVDNFVERGLFKLSKEGFLELTERIGDADDAMGLLTEAMSDNREIAAGGLKTALIELGTAVSTGLNPIITGTYNILTDILNRAVDIINFSNTAGGKKARIDEIEKEIERIENPKFLGSLGAGGSGFGAFLVPNAGKSLEALKLEKSKLEKEIKEILGDALFPSGQDLGTGYEGTNLGFEPRNVGLDIPVTVIDSVKEYDAAIESLNEEISTLTDRSEIASRQDKIAFLENAKNNLLGIEAKKKSGSGSSSKSDLEKATEAVTDYRKAMNDFVLGKELGFFSDQQEIVSKKLSETESFINKLIPLYASLTDEQRLILDDAVIRRDGLQVTLDGLEEADKQEKELLQQQMDDRKEFEEFSKNYLEDELERERNAAVERSELAKQYKEYVDTTRLGTQELQELYTQQLQLQARFSYLQSLNGMYMPENSLSTVNSGNVNIPVPAVGVANSQFFGRGMNSNFSRFNDRDNALSFLTDSSVRMTQAQIDNWTEEARKSYESQQRVNAVLTDIETQLSVGSVASYEFSSNMQQLAQNSLPVNIPVPNVSAAPIGNVNVGFTPGISFNSSTDNVFFDEVKKELENSFDDIEAKARVFGDSLGYLGTGIDVNSLKAQALEKAINELLENGYDPQDEAVQALVDDYEELTAEMNKVSKAIDNVNKATQFVNGLNSFANGIKNRKEDPLGVVQGFGDGLSSGLNLIPGVGPIASQFVQAGTSFVTGFVGFLQGIFDPTKEQRESLASAISDSMKSGMQSAISSFRNGEITLEDLEIALKNSVYDSLFNASLDAFMDSAFETAGLAPLIKEVTNALVSGNDAAVDEAFAKFDAFINSPEFQKFVEGAAELGKRLPRLTNNPDEAKALQPTLVAPLQSVDAGIDFSPIIQGFKDFGVSARMQRETSMLQKETAIKFDKAIDRLLSDPSSTRSGRTTARSYT